VAAYGVQVCECVFERMLVRVWESCGVVVWPCVRLCVGVDVGWGFDVGVGVCASVGGQALSHERDVDRRGSGCLT
jgi:hypothetical protein